MNDRKVDLVSFLRVLQARRGATRCLERKNTVNSTHRSQSPSVVCYASWPTIATLRCLCFNVKNVFFDPARCWKDLCYGGGTFSRILAIPPSSPVLPSHSALFVCFQCYVMRAVWGFLGWSVRQEVTRKIEDEIITAMEHRLPEGGTRGKVFFEIFGSHFAYRALFNEDVIKCGA